MLIRHARRSGSARWFGTSAGLAATSLTTKKLPSWLETKGRTRSFLFDEDNPVVNKEAHKLHKIHLGPENVKANPELARVLADDNVQSWQTNPYCEISC